MKLSLYGEPGETKATIYYSISEPNFPRGAKATSWRMQITVGNWSTETKINNEGYAYVSDLTKGSKQTIYGSVTIKKYWETVSTSIGADGSATTTTHEHRSQDSEDTSIDIYMHPGPWDWSDYISKNDIIELTLKATDINAWVDHLAAWKSWDTQANWYNAYDDYFNPRTGDGFKVNSGDIIYLQWFNNCANAHPRAEQISHQNNEDIISVDIFKTLNFNGTGE